MDMSSSPNIILTGFSGTGKSRVGAEIARVLGWRFLDTDSEIALQTGKKIAAIFAQEGEEAFRLLEKQALKRACTGTGQVVSTGGGILMDPENRKLALGSGLVVGLEASPETIHQRLVARGNSRDPEERPLLAGPDPLKSIRELKKRRQPHYVSAHWLIQTDNLTESQVAAEVIRAWKMLGGKLTANTAVDPELAAVVTHSSGSYPIRVGWGLLDHLGDRLTQMGTGGPVYIISDDNVFPRYGRQAQRSLQRAEIEAHSFIIPAGEESKSFTMAQAIYDWLVHRRAERRHTIVAVGGGVVGDLAGYVAATYLRGIPFVQVPTSMAAMVDASIGGKVAVNLPQAKNLVGAFHQPQMVLADPQVLTSLGRRELAEGWAEAIKHGFILDADLVSVFEEHALELMALEPEITTDVIRQSMAIKAQIVSEDERETLDRRILLNYGHTIGHALEASTNYDRYLHGEGVAIGMMGAAKLSHRLGMIDSGLVERQRRVLEMFGLPLTASGIDLEQLFGAMALDKKSVGGSIRWVLLEGVGKAVSRRGVPIDQVREVVRGLI
jgi:3-dehydroquinate synthase